MRTGAKSYEDQEGESSVVEHKGLKYAMLKVAIGASQGRQERITSIMQGCCTCFCPRARCCHFFWCFYTFLSLLPSKLQGTENLLLANRREASNLVDASLGRCAALLGATSKKSLAQLKTQKTSRRSSAKDALESIDLSGLSGDDEVQIHGRPSSKKARMTLERNDAEEDDDIDGYNSDGADEARTMLDDSGKRRQGRSRQQSNADRRKGLSNEFAKIFTEMKAIARNPTPVAPPPPASEQRTDAIAPGDAGFAKKPE
jgi:hypothetical protein